MIRLTEYRKKNGMSQQDIADRLDISGNTVSQWETGARRPNVDMLVKLARVLGCTPNDILGFEEAEPGQERKEESAE